jgi:hypothetical protein
MMSAGQYLVDGKFKEARAALVPVAYNPHGEEAAVQAKKIIDRIDAGDADGAKSAAGWHRAAAKTTR